MEKVQLKTQNDKNVWYLRVLGEMHSRYGFKADELDPYGPGDPRTIFRKYYLTEVIDPQEFPNRYWLDRSRAGTHGKVLPPALTASDFLCVSREFLEVLERFELGKFVSWSVTLLKKDKETPFEGEWFAVWIGNRKQGFVREMSTSFRIPPYEESKWLSIPSKSATDGDLVMDRSVKDGPDIWRDPTLEKSLLLSDRLHAALSDAGLLRKLKVLRCPVCE